MLVLPQVYLKFYIAHPQPREASCGDISIYILYIYFKEVVQLGPCHSGSGTGTENIVAQLYFSWIGHIPDILFQIQNFSQVTCCIGREFFTSAKVNYCNLGSTAWTVAMP